MLQSLKGYRTLIFNAIMLILMGAKQFGYDYGIEAPQIEGAIDALEAFLTAAWGIGNAILRFNTDTPVGQK